MIFVAAAARRRVRVLLLGLLLSCGTGATAFASDIRELHVSAIPDEAPTELLRKFEPLGAYLQARLGMPVRFVPVTDYAAVVESLAAGHVDLAWLGGFTYVQARRRAPGVQPLVQRQEDAAFRSHFIVRADSDIRALSQLKSVRFVFGSVSSTSGHLMPRHELAQHGVVPERDFLRFAFSGAHDATVAWVAAGKADAGALNAAVWQKLVDAGKVDRGRVRIIATTPPYFDYTWAVRPELPTDLARRIEEAFLSLDASVPEQKAVLDLQRASRFIKTKPDSYESIESAARSAGLISP